MLLILIAIVLFLVGGLLALLAGGRLRAANPFGAATAAIAALLGLTGTLQALTAAQAQSFSVPWRAAGLDIGLRLDGLAAWFLVPLFILVFCSALYAPRYLHRAGARQAGAHWLFHNLLAASMVMVICAADGLIFLAAWELMSLSSFFLVVFDRSEEARRAGWLYLIATQAGTAFLFLFFLLAARFCGSLDFAAFGALKSLPAREGGLLFLALLIGCGSKAGLFPLHVWLPDAHPSAPSHISALMSGVMIKIAVYAFLRLVILLPPLPPWGGWLVTVLGLTGALFGITMAALQNDYKRSLAYSTVENIGIIFFGIGLGLLAERSGQPGIALLAMGGALLHVINHAFFKGLLFFSAGAMLHATGTRQLSALGGLLARMPATGLLLIGGAAAATALPPLNGFISEWLLYLALLKLGLAAAGGRAIVFLILLLLFVLVGGLTLLSFSRLAGIALLGVPRSRPAALAEEVPGSMRAAMAILFGLCLAIGIGPIVAVKVLAAPLAILAAPHNPATTLAGLPPLGLQWSLGAGLLAAVAAAIVFAACRQGRRRPSLPTWGCGFLFPTARMSYKAGGYSQLVQESTTCACLKPEKNVSLPSGLFPGPASFRQWSPDPVLARGFKPLFSKIAAAAYGCRRLQAGQLNIYLFYIFIATTLLLGLAMLPF